MARKQRQRTLRDPIPIIIGEGLTERSYFKGLCELMGYQAKMCKSSFSYQNIKGIDKAIEKALDDERPVIAVFDTDITQWDNGAKKRLNRLREKYEKHNKSEEDNEVVMLCDSLPSIEFWFLLHYKECGRVFRRSDEVLKELKKYMPNFDKCTSFLDRKDWIAELCSGEKMAEAIRRSKQLEDYTKPYSKVYQAIEFLEERKRQEVK